MAKLTDKQLDDVKQALATNAGKLPAGVRINFGDAEPIQKASGESKPATAQQGS